MSMILSSTTVVFYMKAMEESSYPQAERGTSRSQPSWYLMMAVPSNVHATRNDVEKSTDISTDLEWYVPLKTIEIL